MDDEIDRRPRPPLLITRIAQVLSCSVILGTFIFLINQNALALMVGGYVVGLLGGVVADQYANNKDGWSRRLWRKD